MLLIWVSGVFWINWVPESGDGVTGSHLRWIRELESVGVIWSHLRWILAKLTLDDSNWLQLAYLAEIILSMTPTVSIDASNIFVAAGVISLESFLRDWRHFYVIGGISQE